MFSKLFEDVIAKTRQMNKLTSDYRKAEEQACIYKFIPGQGNRRFLSDTSMLEQIIEVIVEATKAKLAKEKIKAITYYLIIKNVATTLNWDKSYGPDIAAYLAYVLMYPAYFQRNGVARYQHTLPAMPDNQKKDLMDIHGYLFDATQLSLQPNDWVTPEALKALEFVCFFGQNALMITDLMQEIMALADVLRQCLTTFEFAAYVHHAVIGIHPYVDGNGRVARALMNTVLMSAGFSPLDVKTTRDLESEYDHVVSNMDVQEFSKWLRQLYFKQDTVILFIDSDHHAETLSAFQFKPIYRCG